MFFTGKRILTKKILQLAQGAVIDYKLPYEVNPENLVVLDGYSEEGYKKISRSKLELIRRFFSGNRYTSRSSIYW